MAGKSKSDGSWQVRSEFSSRYYRRVSTRVWDDARVRRFSAHGKLVWAFLISAPSTTSIPGLFRLPEEEGARLCGLTLEEFREGFLEASQEGMVEADWDAGVVWLRKASRHEWPTGPNVVKGWRTVCASLPECPLVGTALRQIRQQLQEVFSNPEPFLKAFDEGFQEGFLEGFGKPYPSQKQYAEAVTAAVAEPEPESLKAADAVRDGESEGQPARHGAADEPAPPRPALELVSPGVAPTRKPKADDVPPAVLELQAIWNAVAEKHGLQRWKTTTGQRLRDARAAVAAVPDMARWRAFLEAQMENPFFLGQNDRNWTADVDWLLRDRTRVKVADFDPHVRPAPVSSRPIDVRRGNVPAESADHVNHPITEL